MDKSVNPCTDFYKFTCGGYMKKTKTSDELSPDINLYKEMLVQIKKILKSNQNTPETDISVAINIYINCKKLGNY